MMCMNIEMPLAARVEYKTEEATKNLAYAAGSRQGQALLPCTRIGARAQLTDPVRLKRLVEYCMCTTTNREDRGWETGRM
jgi:hypothetical protein